MPIYGPFLPPDSLAHILAQDSVAQAFAPDSLAKRLPAALDWSRIWPSTPEFIVMIGGPVLTYFLTKRNERQKAAEQRERDREMRADMDRRDMLRREEELRRDAMRREDEARRLDYRMRHALAVEVAAFLDAWEPILTNASMVQFDFERMEQDAEAFRPLAATLADIRSDLDRGTAMQWCLLVRNASSAANAVYANPEKPREGEGAVHKELQELRDSRRKHGEDQIEQLLEMARRLRPWISIYDPGEGHDLVMLPDAPPPTPHSTTEPPRMSPPEIHNG